MPAGAAAIRTVPSGPAGVPGLNFHPDRLLRGGRTVAEALDQEGVYRSQFETGISNGGLTAFPGGNRDRWEWTLFGGAYQRPGVRPTERPKYGGLNLLDHPDGTCPRFGSCHLRLRPEVLARATFSFGDSHTEPTEFGTLDVFEPVLTATADTGVSLGMAAARCCAPCCTAASGRRTPPGEPWTTTSRRRSTAS